MEPLNRFKLTIEYDGTPYCGFQKQTDIEQKSIEEVLEEAFFKLTQERVKITASGRTDAGVHALEQVIHADLKKDFDPYKIIMGLNNYLREENVVVLTCEKVDENFHARFSSKKRHYRYIIINRQSPLALMKNRAWHIKMKLNLVAMQQAASYLIGEHDFSSFRDAECQSSSPVKTLEKISVIQNGEEILIEASAKSFLHHMVRNIVGTLVYVGQEKLSADDVKEILKARDRTKSGPNAPACGLYFLKVDY